MKVKLSDINKGLLFKAIISKPFMKANKTSFFVLNKLTRKNKGKNIRGLFCETIEIKRADSSIIRTRVYRKDNNLNNRIPVIYYHGGGYVMSSPEAEKKTIRRLVLDFDLVVIAPDYRIGAEGAFPSAFDDAYTTFLYVKDNYKKLRIRPKDSIVYGGSAGGGLASAVSLKARDEGINYISYLVLLYPMLDYKCSTSSMIDNNAPIWNYKMNKLAWSIYLKNSKIINKYASPSLETNYSGLPKTCVMVGNLDPFLDETHKYVTNLKKAKIPVEFTVFKGAYHAFEVAAPLAKISRNAKDYIFINIKTYLESIKYL